MRQPLCCINQVGQTDFVFSIVDKELAGKVVDLFSTFLPALTAAKVYPVGPRQMSDVDILVTSIDFVEERVHWQANETEGVLLNAI